MFMLAYYDLCMFEPEQRLRGEFELVPHFTNICSASFLMVVGVRYLTCFFIILIPVKPKIRNKMMLLAERRAGENRHNPRVPSNDLFCFTKITLKVTVPK